MPKYVDLEFSARCNLRCGFCFGPTDLGKPDLQTAFWEDVITAIHSRGCSGIVVSGGEPVLYPGVTKLLAHAKKLEMATVLSTHGRLESRLLEVAAFCDWIALPVDGYSQQSVQQLRGDGWGIQSAIKLGFRLKLVVGDLKIKLGSVATALNRKELVNLAAAMSSMNALPFDTWKIYQYTPRRKFAADRNTYSITDLDYENLKKLVTETGITRRLNTVFSSNTSRRRAYLFVYPDGGVAIPNVGDDFGDLSIGNVLTDGDAVFDRAADLLYPDNQQNFEVTYSAGNLEERNNE